MAGLTAPIVRHAEAGETLDALVWRILRKGPSAVEQVLLANPNLADHGLFLPRGLAVVLPVSTSAPAVTPLINLWD